MAQNMRDEVDVSLENIENMKKVVFDEMESAEESTHIKNMDLVQGNPETTKKIVFDEMVPTNIPEESSDIKDKFMKEKNFIKPKASKRRGLRKRKVAPLKVEDCLSDPAVKVVEKISNDQNDMYKEDHEQITCWTGLSSAATAMKQRVVIGYRRLVDSVGRINCFRKRPKRSPTPSVTKKEGVEELQITADRKEPDYSEPNCKETTFIEPKTVKIVDTRGADHGTIEVDADISHDGLMQAVAKELVLDAIYQAQARLMAEQGKLMVADIMSKAEDNLRFVELYE